MGMSGQRAYYEGGQCTGIYTTMVKFFFKSPRFCPLNILLYYCLVC